MSREGEQDTPDLEAKTAMISWPWYGDTGDSVMQVTLGAQSHRSGNPVRAAKTKQEGREDRTGDVPPSLRPCNGPCC